MGCGSHHRISLPAFHSTGVYGVHGIRERGKYQFWLMWLDSQQRTLTVPSSPHTHLLRSFIHPSSHCPTPLGVPELSVLYTPGPFPTATSSPARLGTLSSTGGTPRPVGLLSLVDPGPPLESACVGCDPRGNARSVSVPSTTAVPVLGVCGPESGPDDRPVGGSGVRAGFGCWCWWTRVAAAASSASTSAAYPSSSLSTAPLSCTARLLAAASGASPASAMELFTCPGTSGTMSRALAVLVGPPPRAVGACWEAIRLAYV